MPRANRWRVGEPAGQPLGQRGITLDGHHPGAEEDQWRGEGTRPGPEVEDQIAGGHTAGGDQFSGDLSAQEMRSGPIGFRARPPPPTREHGAS